ncbi:PH domain-containing protein [Nocardioides nematodiphilus]|uniref:PH domain-containing protein n=1 Tax=Nocardioides nematodiphilus TaxID=2849669 RepID=UPI001CD95664|nr:PH domain-containing protein [Nocardioides nematodiphilus]MCA1982810.1 PH domain-containing protein [Nocardioides nematodiphilus]
MPADSEPAALTPLPKTWRPFGVRAMGIVLVIALYGLTIFMWFAFDDETRAKFTVFQKGTLVFFGLLILAVVHALTRSRVEAREEGLVIVNGYKRRDFAWEQVVAVRMPPGAPWATLDIADGTTVPAMGIQASDGGTAKKAVRDLRALVAAPHGS